MASNAPRRWPVQGLSTISGIFADENPCGIYILEFDNGEFYVGQAKDVRKRFVNHCRDTSHHPAWKDITHFSFIECAPRELNVREATTIRLLQQEGRILRNRSLNLFHEQPSPLDKLIPPVDQFHWADSEYLDREAQRISVTEVSKVIAALPEDNSTMSTFPRYESCLRDISAFIDLVLPEPLKTMEQYWTISDAPSTNRGRYYTVNVGVLEMLRCISAFDDASFLNTLPWDFLEGKEDHEQWGFDYEGIDDLSIIVSNHTYPKAPVTVVEFETGRLRELLEIDEDLLAGARALAVALMRTGTAGLFRRWHSRELTREVLTVLREELTAEKLRPADALPATPAGGSPR